MGGSLSPCRRNSRNRPSPHNWFFQNYLRFQLKFVAILLRTIQWLLLKFLVVEWFQTLPIWLEVPEHGVRFVHACWDSGIVEGLHGPLWTTEQLKAGATKPETGQKRNAFHHASEVLLKAPEDEAVPVEDAVRMWTIWGARAIGEGSNRGSIEVGKLADMTVLSDDIYTIPPEQIATVQAEHTIVGGRIVYSRQ